MLSQAKRVLQNRAHAGRLLAEKLQAYKSSEAIVLAVPQGGVPVGHEVAQALRIPFEITFSKRIRHPAHSDLSIGAVSMDEVVLHDDSHFIPQQYVSNQITQLQRQLQSQFNRHYGTRTRTSLENKTVILVDDVLRETDELTAALHSVEKENPRNIVIAAPVATSRTAHLMLNENYRFVYLFMEFLQHNKAFTYFPEISEEEADSLVTTFEL